MGIFESIAVPQSLEHLTLLNYLLGGTFLLLLPYLSILLGTTFYSVIFNKKAEKTGDKKYYRFAKELISLITFNKSIAMALGVLPFLSAVFCYAQLLHTTDLSLSSYLFIALILFVAALILIYTYKNAFYLKDIFTEAEHKFQDADEEIKRELTDYNRKTNRVYRKSGLYGLILLFISSYILIGAIRISLETAKWGSINTIFDLIFSFSTLVYFVSFFAAVLVITSVTILYYIFKLKSKKEEDDPEYYGFIKKFANSTGLIFSGLQPLFITIALLNAPSFALTGLMFGASLVVLFILLIMAHLFYVMLKESHLKFTTSLIYLSIALFVFVIIRDQSAFGTAADKEFRLSSAKFKDYQQQLKADLGITTAEVRGVDIYNGKCVACHQFDSKLVGPPYNEVLPKYVGNKEELVDFILNPVKVNPEYPSMPNQGLKPNEAEAVADYLISTYKESQGGGTESDTTKESN